MVRVHGYKSALHVAGTAGSNQGAAIGSKGIAVVRGAVEINAVFGGPEIAIQQIDVPLAGTRGSGEGIGGDPFLVRRSGARCTLHGGLPGDTSIVGAEDIEAARVELESREVNASLACG